MKNVPAQLRWSELSAAITHESVTIRQRDESRVAGRLVSVDPEALTLRHEKGGELVIPREAITVLQLRQMAKMGRILGAIIGCVLGCAAGVVIVFITTFSVLGPNPFAYLAPLSVVVAVGLPIAGYAVGERVDEKTTQITILPD